MIPQERAALVFGEAQVAAVLGDPLTGQALTMSADRPAPFPDPGNRSRATMPGSSSPRAPPAPPRAWPSATAPPPRLSTPRPASSCRASRSAPTTGSWPGLSVAFDASCEEMWLAWRYGAALVPAPRSLVRSGMDLGPWLISHGITVVSTVPTLAALWPAEALESVRLLIFGGEACPPELADTAGRHRPRSLEHLRPHRGNSGCLCRTPGRAGARAHRPAAGRLGPGRCRFRRRARGRGRGGRTDHCRRRPGPLPGSGQGCRKVRPHARRSAGTAPTAAGTWCGWRARGWSSWAAPTTR